MGVSPSGLLTFPRGSSVFPPSPEFTPKSLAHRLAISCSADRALIWVDERAWQAMIEPAWEFR